MKTKSPKLLEPVVLFCRIEAKQRKELLRISTEDNRTMAAVVREALDFYLTDRLTEGKVIST